VSTGSIICVLVIGQIHYYWRSWSRLDIWV